MPQKVCPECNCTKIDVKEVLCPQCGFLLPQETDSTPDQLQNHFSNCFFCGHIIENSRKSNACPGCSKPLHIPWYDKVLIKVFTWLRAYSTKEVRFYGPGVESSKGTGFTNLVIVYVFIVGTVWLNLRPLPIFFEVLIWILPFLFIFGLYFYTLSKYPAAYPVEEDKEKKQKTEIEELQDSVKRILNVKERTITSELLNLYEKDVGVRSPYAKRMVELLIQLENLSDSLSPASIQTLRKLTSHDDGHVSRKATMILQAQPIPHFNLRGEM